jgi:hypothetical protein
MIFLFSFEKPPLYTMAPQELVELKKRNVSIGRELNIGLIGFFFFCTWVGRPGMRWLPTWRYFGTVFFLAS